jgi:hypothetical protein
MLDSGRSNDGHRIQRGTDVEACPTDDKWMYRGIVKGQFQVIL